MAKQRGMLKGRTGEVLSNIVIHDEAKLFQYFQPWKASEYEEVLNSPIRDEEGSERIVAGFI